MFCNDEVTLEQISAMVEAGTVHSIVISPGPGTPDNTSDIGAARGAVNTLRLSTEQLSVPRPVDTPHCSPSGEANHAQLLAVFPPRISSGVCLDVLRSLPDVPVLGICLGHQALAQVLNGEALSAAATGSA